MKITLQTQDFPEETWKNFAIFLGWTEQIMTTTESPNYLIKNPQTYTDYIVSKYGEPIWRDIAEFNIIDIKTQQDNIEKQTRTSIKKAKNDAEIQALALAKTIVTSIIE